MKKYLALLLALIMTLAVFTGCGTEKPSGDDVVMNYDGFEVTWDQFMYYLYYASNTLTSYYSSNAESDVDWSGECIYDRTVTNAEWCVNEALYMAAQGMMLQSKAKELNCEASEDQINEFKTQIESYKENFASEDDPDQAFADALREQGYTEESLMLNGAINSAFTNVFEKLYGEMGENLDDETFNSFVSENGYMKSAHILLLFSKNVENEDGTYTQEALSDDQKAENKAKLEAIVTELQAISDDTQRKEKFFEYMNEMSEDGGLASYPNGYTFTEGVMVEEYTDATEALKDYEVSGIVESTYGYHVLMRLPIERSDVPYSGSSSTYTLGYIAASYALDDEMQEWDINSISVLNDAYKDADFTQFFGADGFTFTTYAEYTAAKAE